MIKYVFLRLLKLSSSMLKHKFESTGNQLHKNSALRNIERKQALIVRIYFPVPKAWLCLESKKCFHLSDVQTVALMMHPVTATDSTR